MTTKVWISMQQAMYAETLETERMKFVEGVEILKNWLTPNSDNSELLPLLVFSTRSGKETMKFLDHMLACEEILNIKYRPEKRQRRLYMDAMDVLKQLHVYGEK